MSVRPTDQLSEAIEKMAKNGFRRLPVVFEDALVGILTATDVLKVLSSGETKLLTEELHNFMTNDPIVINRDAKISEAVQTMFQHGLGSLPIVTKNMQLSGIVTERDLVKAFAGSFADAELEEFLKLNPITLPYATTTVKKVIDTMVSEDVRRIVLVEKDNKVKGIITSTDMMRFFMDKIVRVGSVANDVFKTKAKDICKTNVKSVTINTSVADIAKILSTEGMGGIPVINDDNELLGVFTESDLLQIVGMYNLM